MATLCASINSVTYVDSNNMGLFALITIGDTMHQNKSCISQEPRFRLARKLVEPLATMTVHLHLVQAQSTREK